MLSFISLASFFTFIQVRRKKDPKEGGVLVGEGAFYQITLQEHPWPNFWSQCSLALAVTKEFPGMIYTFARKANESFSLIFPPFTLQMTGNRPIAPKLWRGYAIAHQVHSLFPRRPLRNGDFKANLAVKLSL